MIAGGGAAVAYFEHLDEGDCQVEVDSVAKVEGEGHKKPHRHDAQHVETHGHLALDLHHPQHLHHVFCSFELLKDALTFYTHYFCQAALQGQVVNLLTVCIGKLNCR